MEFLVRIQNNLPGDLPDERRQSLMEAEAARGRELIASKNLLRIWRVPGRRANVSLYRAVDATELHGLISSLPLWPWMDIQVEPLATHALDPEA